MEKIDMVKVAVLDDWQGLARNYADWDRLAGRADISFFADAFPSEDQAAAELSGFDILLTVQDRMKLPGSLIARLPRLQMIGITMSNSALDMAACARRGIVVYKTDGPGEHGAWAPAELALGLLIAAFRSIPAADAAVRRGSFQHSVPAGRTLSGKTLGIIGLGRLGSRVAGYAAALGMDVLAWNPNLDAARAASAGARSVPKEMLLEAADAISIHVTLSAQSRGLIGGSEIARMKPGAVLINTSRGPIVDETALVAALRAGRIIAALDVFDDEPIPDGHPLRAMANTVLTPHLGYGVEETWRTVYPQSLENVLAFLDGRSVRVVEPPRQ